MLALFVLRSCWGRRWVLQESTLYNLPVKPRWSPSAWDQRARLSLKSHLAVERPSAGRWTVFTEVKHRKTSRFQFCQPSFCLPVFFKHSLFPPHPTPPPHQRPALHTVCLVTHGGTSVHLYFLCARLSLLPTSQDKEAHEGST